MVDQDTSKMKKQGFIVITELMIIFAILHSGGTTKCFVCNSFINEYTYINEYSNETCESNPKESEAIDCGEGICFKCNNETDKQNLLRTCFNPENEIDDFIKDVLNKLNCTMCFTDFCNNANALSTGMLTLGCLALFWTIRFVLADTY